MSTKCILHACQMNAGNNRPDVEIERNGRISTCSFQRATGGYGPPIDSARDMSIRCSVQRTASGPEQYCIWCTWALTP